MNGKAYPKGFINIAQIVEAPRGIDLREPWFMVETYYTSDGPRTRICNGRWATLQQAQTALAEKQQENSE